MIEVRDLVYEYPTKRALDGVSLTVQPQTITALVGPNGAGKTTLLRTIAGAHPASGGRVLLRGAEFGELPAHRRVAMGIALVPEGRKLFSRMTVEENLLLARSAGRPGRWTVDAVMQAFPNLQKRRRSLAAHLSGGEQQATAIGRALMTNPDVLLLDEVSLGLSPLVVDQVYAQLEVLMAGGTTILLVEQDLRRALRIADRVICMLEGSIVLEGAAADLTREQVTEAYFGLHRNAAGGVAA
jgi:branched-chain amino acid transport system ATP-binding protein